MMNRQQNIDPEEQRKFAALAHSWWDPEGDFKPLHDLNPARLKFIAERCRLQDASVLDVGCGGGILSEALSREGARVTGIDVVEKTLRIAALHLHESGLEIDYRQQTAESLAETMPQGFQVLTCLEMLEHVPDPAAVIRACAQLTEPGGHLFFSTINRTPQAFVMAIVGAERVLQLLPKGTHEYRKLIRPSELSAWIRAAGLNVLEIKGLHYNPLNRAVRIGGHVAVNYLLHARKPEQQPGAADA